METNQFVDTLLSNLNSKAQADPASVSKLVGSLFSMLPPFNPDIAIYLEEELGNYSHLKGSPRYQKELRAYWVKLWDNGLYSETQEKYFRSHYKSLAVDTQKNLAGIIEKNNIEKMTLPLNIAVWAQEKEAQQLVKHFYYSRDINILKDYVKSKDSLPPQDALQILCGLKGIYHYSEYDHELIQELIEKSKLTAHQLLYSEFKDTFRIAYETPEVYQKYYNYFSQQKDFNPKLFDVFTPYQNYTGIKEVNLPMILVSGLLYTFVKPHNYKEGDRDTFDIKRFFNFCDNMSFALEKNIAPTLTKLLESVAKEEVDFNGPQFLIKNFASVKNCSAALDFCLKYRLHFFNRPEEVNSFKKLFKTATQMYLEKSQLSANLQPATNEAVLKDKPDSRKKIKI